VNRDTPTAPSNNIGAEAKEVTLRVFLEIFDRYVRSVAEITAEAGLSDELTVEALMAYCIALPEADELVLGFLRGDMTMFSMEEQTRYVVERDTRFLELEPVIPASENAAAKASSRLDKALAQRRAARGDVPASPAKTQEIETFIRKNPEIFRHVRDSSHEFLVRWVMLYLMQVTKARERGHKVAHGFWRRFPGIGKRIANGKAQSLADPSKLRQRGPAKGPRLGSL